MKRALTVLSMVLFTIGCDNTFIDLSHECETSADCADGDPCTVGLCEVDHTCLYLPSDDPACEPPPECVPTDEVCNGLDDDCDGLTDEGCEPELECRTDEDCAHLNNECYIFRCYPAGECFPIERDDDGDGYGVDCGVTSGRDCNDHNPAVHPDATELCDSVDNDCDGETDEGCEPPPDCVVGRICDCGADGYGVERCSPDGTSMICECPVCGDGICTMFWTRTDTGEGYWNCLEDCPPRCEDGHCATVVLRIACPSDDPDCQIWYSAGGAGEAQAGVLQRYVGSLRCIEPAEYLAGININARVGGPGGAWYSDIGRLPDLVVTIDDASGVCSIESGTMAADNWMVEEGATTNLFCPAAYLSC